MQCFGILRGKARELTNGRVLFENDLSLAVGVDFQRITLADAHGASDLLGDHHAAEIVDAAYNSRCFHLYKPKILSPFIPADTDPWGGFVSFCTFFRFIRK